MLLTSSVTSPRRNGGKMDERDIRLAGDVTHNGDGPAARRADLAHDSLGTFERGSLTVTAYPSAASLIAMARPMPEPAPVTRAAPAITLLLDRRRRLRTAH